MPTPPKLSKILQMMTPPTPTPRPALMSDPPDPVYEAAAKATPWYSAFQKRYGEAPNLYAPEYNLRRAMQLGVQATPDPYDQNFPHWPDAAPGGEMLKSPDHPTVWMQHFMDATKDQANPNGIDPETAGINDYATARQYLGRDFVPPDVLSAIQKRGGQ